MGEFNFTKLAFKSNFALVILIMTCESGSVKATEKQVLSL